MTVLTDLHARAIELYNAGDIDGFCDLYAEDAVLATPDGTYAGRGAIREYWSRNKASFPVHHLTVTTSAETGDRTLGELTWTGINTGPLYMPDGSEIPATGKSVEFNGMEMTQVRGDKIVVHKLYWDNMAALSQLGLIPPS